VEISRHFNLAFSQCSTSIFQAFDGQTEFSQVFNFVSSSYSRNSRKFDTHKKCVLQYFVNRCHFPLFAFVVYPTTQCVYDELIQMKFFL